MIPHVEFHTELERQTYHGTPEQFEEFLKMFDTLSDFKQFEAHKQGSSAFIQCFKGCELIKNPVSVERGYGLTVASVEKYIVERYGKNNPKLFFITAGLFSTEYEKPWKFGSFIDLDGKNEDEDFQDGGQPRGDEEDAEIDGKFICFNVFDIDKAKL